MWSNLIIVLGISEQEDFHLPEIPLEKTREIDNEVRISKKAEMKRKFNRNQKCITPWDIQLSSLTSSMWVIIFWLNPECVIEKIKSLKVKLIKHKTYHEKTVFKWKE